MMGEEQLQWLEQSLDLLSQNGSKYKLGVFVSTMPWVDAHSKWGEFKEERKHGILYYNVVFMYNLHSQLHNTHLLNLTTYIHTMVLTQLGTRIANMITSRSLSHKIIMLSGDAHMLGVDDGTNSEGGFPVFHAAGNVSFHLCYTLIHPFICVLYPYSSIRPIFEIYN